MLNKVMEEKALTVAIAVVLENTAGYPLRGM
jgi:hypothetical protein